MAMSLLQFQFLNPNICTTTKITPIVNPRLPKSNVVKASNVCETTAHHGSSNAVCLSSSCSYVKYRAFFPASAPPRRMNLRCPPPQGKHVREDYLVVNTLLTLVYSIIFFKISVELKISDLCSGKKFRYLTSSISFEFGI